MKTRSIFIRKYLFTPLDSSHINYLEKRKSNYNEVRFELWILYVNIWTKIKHYWK